MHLRKMKIHWSIMVYPASPFQVDVLTRKVRFSEWLFVEIYFYFPCFLVYRVKWNKCSWTVKALWRLTFKVPIYTPYSYTCKQLACHCKVCIDHSHLKSPMCEENIGLALVGGVFCACSCLIAAAFNACLFFIHWFYKKYFFGVFTPFWKSIYYIKIYSCRYVLQKYLFKFSSFFSLSGHIWKRKFWCRKITGFVWIFLLYLPRCFHLANI